MFWLWVFIIYLYEAATFLRTEWFMRSPPYPHNSQGRIGEIKRTWFVAGFDMWMGAYLDKKNFTAYWFPIPFVGMKIERPIPKIQ